MSASAEKPSPPPVWNSRLEKQRESVARFEAEVETWRFGIRNATSSVSYEEGDAFLNSIPDFLVKSQGTRSSSDEIIAFVAKEIRNRYGQDVQITERRLESYQRDREQGFYRVWEKISGGLSIFDRRGTWNQDESDISIGPIPTHSEIEVYLARLGLAIPRSASAEEIVSATPTDPSQEQVYVIDLEGSRFRFGCRPWLGSGLVESVRETSLWEGREQGLLEKRRWYQMDGGLERQEVYPFYPLIGAELQYHSDTTVESIALRRFLALRLDPSGWFSFPKERPPFGWPVLDYRFKPEVEYRFGFQTP